MTAELEKINPYFMQLVLSLQAAAMQHMGKVMNQMSGKIERDLMMAQTTIDMLSMIESKTKGNLTEEENKLMTHILYELRLNFVDESKKTEETESEKNSDTNTEENQKDSNSGSTDNNQKEE